MTENGCRYRPLTLKELKDVETEFVQFLAANSVTAPDWETLKKRAPEKADGLIAIFSNLYWGKALGRITHLMERLPKVFRVFWMDGCLLHLIEVRLPEEAPFRFDCAEDLEGWMTGKKDVKALGGKFFRGTRNTGDQRDRELFELLERGAVPCRTELYLVFNSALSQLP